MPDVVSGILLTYNLYTFTTFVTWVLSFKSSGKVWFYRSKKFGLLNYDLHFHFLEFQ